MFGRKTISSKKIGELQNYNSYGSIAYKSRKRNNLFAIFVIIACVFVIGFFGKYIIQGAQIVGSQIGKGTVALVSNSIGTEMQKDELGNINIAIAGYGGEGHQGAFLTDSMMIASWNPKLGAITMISIPRDLYIHNKELSIKGRINELFTIGMEGRKRLYETGAYYLVQQFEDIVGLQIPYYALIDFDGFESFIDSLGGLDIFVSETIHDTTFPKNETEIMTFHVNSGINHFDGATALMYARSRHSSSDFSRSLRQQQIIKAIMDQLTSKGNLLNPSKLKSLYEEYVKIVKTNISLDEIIGISKHAYDLKHIFSFGLTTDCSNANWKFSVPGCFLWAPPRELFDGAAIMAPVGPDPANISFYDYINKFAFFVMHNQEYLIENANIVIQNGIDKNYAKQIKKKLDGNANKIAAKLKKFAFNIVNVENTKTILTGTTVYVLGTGEYAKTIDILKYFVPIDTVILPEILSGQTYTATTGADLVIVLGNSYIDKVDYRTFSYYK